MAAQIFRAKDVKTHRNRFSHLASGSYGRVHYCFTEGDHTVAGHIKAVKLLRLSGSEEAMRDQGKQAEAEIKALRKTKTSDFTVQFYGTVEFELQEWIGIVMEYMPRRDLYDLLKIRKLNIPLLLRFRILYHVAKGLEHLHTVKYDRRISHNDLKPQNVLLDEGFQAKICDFGASDFAARTSATFREEIVPHKIHTPSYAAPEFLEDRESQRTRRMDVFSYALVAYFTLHSQDLYTLHEDESMVSVYKNPEEPKLKGIQYPFEIKSVEEQKIEDLLLEKMQKCWQRSPEERPDIADVRQDMKLYYKKYKIDIETTVSEIAKEHPVDRKFPRLDEDLITLDDLCREIVYGVVPGNREREALAKNTRKVIQRIPIQTELGESDEFELQTPKMVYRCVVKERIQLVEEKTPNDMSAEMATSDARRIVTFDPI